MPRLQVIFPRLTSLSPLPPSPPSLLPQRIKDHFYDMHNSQLAELEEALVDQKRLDDNLEVRHDIFSVLRVRGNDIITCHVISHMTCRRTMPCSWKRSTGDDGMRSTQRSHADWTIR